MHSATAASHCDCSGWDGTVFSSGAKAALPEESLWTFFEQLSLEKKKAIIDEIIKKYPSMRVPMGGALRTGSFSVSLRVPGDYEYLEILRMVEDQKYGVDFSEIVINNKLVVFFSVYNLLASASIKDYELSIGLGNTRFTEMVIEIKKLESGQLICKAGFTS